MSRCRRCIIRTDCTQYKQRKSPPGGCGRYLSHGTHHHRGKPSVNIRSDLTVERGTYQVFHRR
ncbi:MAG: hypothetical protein GF368_01515 [Candidatus Aenigmarchaeota archaeon]|nr:hypothetical protein [Candidatus Aenigmarchaeota archaeon]